MKTKNYKHKLTSYSALALGVILTESSSAQTIYTDIDPDSILQYTGEFMMFDFNDDGINDLELQAFYGSYVSVTSYSTSIFFTNQVALIPQPGCEIACNLVGDPKLFEAEREIHDETSFFQFTSAEGIIISISDYEPNFIGFKVTTGTETHLGWLRLLNTPDGVELKDYAYELTDAAPIITHSPNTPYIVQNVIAADIGDAHNITDIQVSFDVPDDESNISSYRIFIEPWTSFNLYMLNNSEPNKYTEVFPDGTNKIVPINVGQLDLWDNEIIESDFLYVYVESVSNIKPEESVVTDFPSVFMYGFKVDTVSIVSVYQVPGPNFEVQFVSPEDISGIINYFTYITPYDELPIIDSLFYFTNDNRHVFNSWEVPGEEWDPATLYTTTVIPLDVNGNELVFGVAYGVCVQSHTLFDNYSEYRYEAITCSGPITLVDPTAGINNSEIQNVLISVTNNTLQIDLSSDIIFPATIQIINAEGQIVFVESVSQNANSFLLDIKAGVYIVIVKTDNSKYVKKFILEF